MAEGNIGQDDIDKLIAELGGDAPPAAPAAPAPVAAPAPAPVAAAAAEPAAAGGTSAAEASTSLDQDEIDGLLSKALEVTKAPMPSATTSTTGRLDQNDIDKLLADLNPTTRRESKPASSTGGLSQEDIDKLLSELNVQGAGNDSQVASAAKPAVQTVSADVAAAAAAASQAVARPTTQTLKPSTASTSKPATAAIKPTTGAAKSAADAAAKPPTAAIKPTTGAASKPGTAKVKPAGTDDAPEGPLSQDDIDKLLSELGGHTPSLGAPKVQVAEKAPDPAASGPDAGKRRVPPAPEPVAAAPAKGSEATMQLSAEEIDQIVAKQDAAPPGHESEAVIAQSDIDALVQQLAKATGGPDPGELGAELAKKADEIDRVQQQAASMPPPEVTRDAVDVNSVLGKTQSTATVLLQPASVASTTVTTVEFRFARSLLFAAVLILGICCGSLIWLTRSVHDLSGEIRKEREVERPVSDGFAGKLTLAVAKLREPDDAEQARAVRWLEELRRIHPDHAADLSLVLARHYRSRQAWRRAADEYAAVVEAGLPDDPRVLLEQSECISAQGDLDGAVRQIYVLLGNERGWLGDGAGSDLERNRQALSDAYLVLGRLLTRLREGGGTAVASNAGAANAEPAHTPAATGHGAPAPEHGQAAKHAEAAPAAGGHH